MHSYQIGILASVPAVSRYLAFNLAPGCQPGRVLHVLKEYVDGERIVLGLGLPFINAMAVSVAGLPVFPAYAGSGFSVPSTPFALWCWLRGDDRGDLVLRTHDLTTALADDVQLVQVIDAFRHRDGRDLTGYEDGTENPEGDDAVAAAFVRDADAGMEGSSFVAVQQWVHNFPVYDGMSSNEQDNSIGRRKSDNEELDDAPESAHVKRTAQESFAPEAFVLRRSMPWADAADSGLMFVAFGKSTDAFAAQLHRMVGAEDGVVDALFHFTQPVTGSYFWCPPLLDERLDLRKLGL